MLERGVEAAVVEAAMAGIAVAALSHIHPLNDHPGYSNDYLNRISWQSEDKVSFAGRV